MILLFMLILKIPLFLFCDKSNYHLKIGEVEKKNFFLGKCNLKHYAVKIIQSRLPLVVGCTWYARLACTTDPWIDGWPDGQTARHINPVQKSYPHKHKQEACQ